mgnify:CR=1 FL=1
MTTGLYGLEQSIEQTVEQFLKDSNTIEIGSHGLEELGLDSRCGRILISEEGGFVAVRNTRSIEYYGGWEYIDGVFKLDAGDYRFYDGEANRVGSVIRFYRELIQGGYRYEFGKGFVDSNGLTIAEVMATKSATEQEQ